MDAERLSGGSSNQIGFGEDENGIAILRVPSAVGQFPDTSGSAGLFPLNQYVGYSGPLSKRTTWWADLFLRWATVNFAVATEESKKVLQTIGTFYRDLLGLSPSLRFWACNSGKSANLSALHYAVRNDPQASILCSTLAHSSITGGHRIRCHELPAGKFGSDYFVPAADIRAAIEKDPSIKVLVVTLGVTHTGILDVSELTPEFVAFLKGNKIWIHVDATLGGPRGALLPAFTGIRRRVLETLALLRPDSITIGLYKAVGVISGALLYIEAEHVSDAQGAPYYRSGTSFGETSVPGLPFAMAAEVIERMPLAGLQLLNFFAFYASVEFYHSVRHALSLGLGHAAERMVGHANIDSIVIEVGSSSAERQEVIDLLRQALLDVAYADFATTDGAVYAIRVVFRQDWIWDSYFLRLLGHIIGISILRAKGLVDETNFLDSVALFHRKVGEQKTALPSDEFGETKHRIPFALFRLIEEHDFFSETDGNKSFVAFWHFKDHLEQALAAGGDAPELLGYKDWPDPFWLERVKSGLMYHQTRFDCD